MYCRYKSQNKFTARDAEKLSVMNENGLSAISYLQQAPCGYEQSTYIFWLELLKPAFCSLKS
jgi:hypothetical protein